MNLVFLDIYDRAYPVDVFLQHVHKLIHVQFKGDVTLKKLSDALESKFEGMEKEQLAAKDFIDFQKENGVSDDDVVCSTSGDRSIVFHFDLISK